MKEDWLSNGDANLKTKEMLLSQFKCETAYQDFNTHAQFHAAYLRALFEAKNITYSKKRPGDVLKPFYLQQLLTRIEFQPEQLTTFRHFIYFCKIVKSKLPN